MLFESWLLCFEKVVLSVVLSLKDVLCLRLFEGFGCCFEGCDEVVLRLF